jgi:hypothetical protein
MQTIKQLFLFFLALSVTGIVLAQTTANISPAAPGKPSKVNVKVDNQVLNNQSSNISQPGNKNPRNIVWVEFGDGQFTTSPESMHSFFLNDASGFPFMLIKSTGIYAKGGRPPKHTVKKVPAQNKSNLLIPEPSVFYNRNENVRIIPNVFDIAAGDTMFYALSYRKPENAPNGLYRLLFFYNQNRMSVFEPIKPFGFYRVFDEGTAIPVPFVRTHFGETLIKPNELPEMLFKSFKKEFDQSGYLVFNINLTDSREHHIFLTMIPHANIPDNANLKASMNLLLIPPDNNLEQYEFNSRLIGNLASHDPNWQEVNPKCIVLPKKNQEIKYQVHFQNTGLGPARSVKIKTALPDGVRAEEIEVTGWSIGGIKNNPNYHLNIERNANDSILFDFVYDQNNTRIVLYGAVDLPDAPVNPKTMGDIYFKCLAKPGTPNNEMHSGTSIYFDENEAVKTNDTKVEFKKCCDCDNDCNIKSKSKFARWLFCKNC